MSHFGNVTVGTGLDFDSEATLNLPVFAADPATGTDGDLIWNSTSSTVKAYNGVGWASVTTTAGSMTLDSCYNNGKTMAIDEAAFAITGSHATNDAFTITHASAGSGDLIVLTGDNTGKLLNLVSTADADAMLVTADSVTDQDVVKINADGLTTGSALVVESSGTIATGSTGLLALNAAGLTDGTALVITTAAATMSGGYYLRCYDGAANDFTIAEDGVVTIAGAAEGTDALVLTKGDITVTDGDLTLSGGKVAITDGVTTSGAGLTVTTSATTAGDGILVTANSLTTGSAIKAISSGTVTSSGTGIVEITTTGMTTGNALQIRVAEATLAGGKYIDLYDTTGTASIWSVGEDGNTVMAGTALGTDALTLTTGDLTLSSGNITLENATATAVGTIITGYQNSATPAAQDQALKIAAYGEEATSSDKILYGQMTFEVEAATDGATSGQVKIGVDTAGSIKESFFLTDGHLGIGDGAAMVFGSNGSYNLSISTAVVAAGLAANEPKIVLTDGAAGDITVTAGGTSGQVVVASPMQRNIAAGVTADVGSGQGDGAFTADILEVSVAATDGDAVTLPVAVAGKVIMVINHGASSIDIFPVTSSYINEGSINAAVACAANASRMFIAYDATHWESLLMARA